MGWRLLKVSGHSMWPILADGDFVLVRPLGRAESLAENSIVLVDHPRFGEIIKRVGRAENGYYRLRGYAAESVSEAELGQVERQRICGRIIMRIAPGGVFRTACVGDKYPLGYKYP